MRSISRMGLAKESFDDLLLHVIEHVGGCKLTPHLLGRRGLYVDKLVADRPQ